MLMIEALHTPRTRLTQCKVVYCWRHSHNRVVTPIGCVITTRPIPRNSLITEYEGALIDRQQAQQLRLAKASTHVRVLNMQHTCIDGIKQPARGLGRASFANDGRSSYCNNAVFYTRFDHKLARDRVYLKATEDLPAGTEVLVSYGATFWDLQADGDQHTATGKQMQPLRMAVTAS